MTFALLPLLLAAGPVCGGPIDLDTALGLAVTRSDEVAIKRSEVAAAEADVALARALRYVPQATATLIVGPSPSARGYADRPGGVLVNPVPADQTSNIWDWERIKGLRAFTRVEVQAVQPLYTWGRLDAARDAANAGVRARQDLVQDTASQVQLRIHQLYWGVSLARRFLAISADVTKAIDDAAARVKKALKQGDADISPQDEFKIEVFRGTVAGRTADAQKALELSQLGLAATLGVEPSQLQLKEAALEPVAGDVPDEQQLLAQAALQRPDLRALDEAILARKAEVRAARGERLPQVFLGFGFTWAWAPNRDDPANPWISDYFDTHSFPSPGFLLGVRQDLALGTLGAKVQKAEAELATLQKQREGMLRLVEVQVSTAAAELRAARTRFVAAQSAFNAARSLYRSAGLDFAAGLLETSPLIDAYKQYVENQVTAAQAAYDLVLARARLAQAAGEAPRKAITCESP